MVAILEWTLSNVQQNIEQLQTPTMGVTTNKKSTTAVKKSTSLEVEIYFINSCVDRNRQNIQIWP